MDVPVCPLKHRTIASRHQSGSCGMSRPEVFDSRWKDDIVTTIETWLRHGCHGFILVHLVDIEPAYS